MAIHFTANGFLQIILYFLVLFTSVKPLGTYIAKIYMGRPVLLDRVLGPLERCIYKIAGIGADEEMTWQQYAAALLLFSVGSLLSIYFMLRHQSALPFNPQHFPDFTPDLAFNTAASYLTNTDWQSYVSESSVSYFSQFAGLTVQNFTSAAIGMVVMVALIRGLVRKNTDKIGNFWIDMVRTNLYILLPLALLWVVIIGSQGVVQTFGDYITVPPLETHADAGAPQTIAVGPAASQVAIKQLGSNGGGFFNANSAHPFENPTPLSNFFEMLAILLIPAALCYSFGMMIDDQRQGLALLIAMTLIFVPLLFTGIYFEQGGNPRFTALGIDQMASDMQAGGNMEGKETRLGITSSVIWASATTAASNGSYNAMHDSFTPLGGLIPLAMLQFSEVIYGGVGCGLYGMLMYVLIAVFIAGLMVGRTPEYLGKKIQVFEIKMTSVAILVTPFVVLLGTAIACLTVAGKAGVFNPGAHGFTEILYNLTSAGDNNGSPFAGLNTNTVFYNVLLGIVTLFGRYWTIVPVLAIAGSLAKKNTVPATIGTLPTHTPLFIGVLIATIILLGMLTYLPSMALGPIAEYLSAGR